MYSNSLSCKKMKKKIKTVGNKKVVILSGKITGLDAVMLHKTLEDFKKGKDKEIIVDLLEVEYMDSNCLGALLYSQILLNKYDKSLVLSAPHGFIENLFRNCSFDKIFKIIESYE